MNEAAIILKRDACGRVVVAEQQRVELVRAYERSGLSCPKFAVSVNRSTLSRGLTRGESLKEQRARWLPGRESAVGDAAPAPTHSA